MTETTFGVEIEFLVNAGLTKEAVAAQLEELTGLAVKGAYRQTAPGRGWKIVQDGSVQGMGRAGLEAVSPILREGDFDQIDKICRGLSTIGARVNRSCGLHVHVGAQGMSLDAMKRLAIIYAELEGFLDQLLPPSRRANNNAFCRSVKTNINVQKVLNASDVQRVAGAIGSGVRYMKLNFTSFWRLGTVEFRHHSGTIDPEKIKHWAYLCDQLAAAAQREVLMPAIPPVTTAPSPTATAPVNAYWTSGRRRRAIYSMIARDEGATEREIQEYLGLSSPPGVSFHVNRAGDARLIQRHGHRNGAPIWRLAVSVPTPAAPPATPPAAMRIATNSLDDFLDRLRMPPTHRTYWLERAALLQEPA